MRGKLSEARASRVAERITPAHAGKTLFRALGEQRNADHPRACGENTSEMAYFRG